MLWKLEGRKRRREAGREGERERRSKKKGEKDEKEKVEGKEERREIKNNRKSKGTSSLSDTIKFLSKAVEENERGYNFSGRWVWDAV